MTPSISVHDVWFTGTLDIDRHGQLYIPHPGPVNYSGAGPEVDRAWKELTWGKQLDSLDTFLSTSLGIYGNTV